MIRKYEEEIKRLEEKIEAQAKQLKEKEKKIKELENKEEERKLQEQQLQEQQLKRVEDIASIKPTGEKLQELKDNLIDKE